MMWCDFRCESRYEFDGRKSNSRQKWNNDKCRCEFKNSIKYCACEEDYIWNPNTCACECNKDCEIGECLGDCECIADDLVITCDETEDIPENAIINPGNGIYY